MAKKSDVVILKGGQYWGTVGNHECEKVFGAKFVVDIVMEYDMSEQCQTDVFESGYSYMQLNECAKRVIENEDYNLIQRAAERIAEEVRKECPKAGEIEVTVKKPFVGIGSIVEYTAVTVYR